MNAKTVSRLGTAVVMGSLILTACRKPAAAERETTSSEMPSIRDLIPASPATASADYNALLEGVPSGVSDRKELEVHVKGQGLTNYVYKIGPAAITVCSEAYDYILRPIDSAIKEDLGRFPDGDMNLCVAVLGQSRVWQRFDQALKATWTKETGALPAPKNFKDIPDRNRISLFWDGIAQAGSALLVRSSAPIMWLPQDGQSYSIGTEVAPGVSVLAQGPATSFVDSSVVDGKSFYYAVYSVNADKKYSPPAVLGSIPGLEPYAWIQAEAGAYLKNAVPAGSADGTNENFVCRSAHRDASGLALGVHPGKFQPKDMGNLNTGTCVYTYGPEVFSSPAYEMLVITRGSFSDWFLWQGVTGDAYVIPPAALKVADDADGKALFTCRARIAQSSDYVLGKSFNNGCHLQSANGFLKAIGPHDLLLRK